MCRSRDLFPVAYRVFAPSLNKIPKQFALNEPDQCGAMRFFNRHRENSYVQPGWRVLMGHFRKTDAKKSNRRNAHTLAGKQSDEIDSVSCAASDLPSRRYRQSHGRSSRLAWAPSHRIEITNRLQEALYQCIVSIVPIETTWKKRLLELPLPCSFHFFPRMCRRQEVISLATWSWRLLSRRLRSHKRLDRIALIPNP